MGVLLSCAGLYRRIAGRRLAYRHTAALISPAVYTRAAHCAPPPARVVRYVVKRAHYSGSSALISSKSREFWFLLFVLGVTAATHDSLYCEERKKLSSYGIFVCREKICYPKWCG